MGGGIAKKHLLKQKQNLSNTFTRIISFRQKVTSKTNLQDKINFNDINISRLILCLEVRDSCSWYILIYICVV